MQPFVCQWYAIVSRRFVSALFLLSITGLPIGKALVSFVGVDELP